MNAFITKCSSKTKKSLSYRINNKALVNAYVAKQVDLDYYLLQIQFIVPKDPLVD